MDDFVKTVRAAHMTLIVLATAFFGFALAPSDSERYTAAKNELDLLRKVPFEEYPFVVAPIAKQREKEIAAFYRKLMRDVASPYKVSEELYFSSPLVVEWPDASYSLEKIVDFLEKENSVGLTTHILDSQIPVAFREASAGLASSKCVDLGTMRESPCGVIPRDHALDGVTITKGRIKDDGAKRLHPSVSQRARTSRQPRNH